MPIVQTRAGRKGETVETRNSQLRLYADPEWGEDAEHTTRILCGAAAIASAARGSERPRTFDTPEIQRASGYLPVGSMFGRAAFGSAGQLSHYLDWTLEAIADGFALGTARGRRCGVYRIRESVRGILAGAFMRSWPAVMLATPMTVSTIRSPFSAHFSRSFFWRGSEAYTGGAGPQPPLAFGYTATPFQLTLPRLARLGFLLPELGDRRTSPMRIRFYGETRYRPPRGNPPGHPLRWVDAADSLVFPLAPTDEEVRATMSTTPNRPRKYEIYDRGTCIGGRHPCFGLWLVDPSGLSTGVFTGYQLKVIMTPGGRLIAIDTVTRQMNAFLQVARLVRGTLDRIVFG